MDVITLLTIESDELQIIGKKRLLRLISIEPDSFSLYLI
jgi:hypothetical protein